MDTPLALLVGLLFACAFYSLMRRGVAAIAVGVLLLGHATNLLLFCANGLVREHPALVPEGELGPTLPFADPLPQALILTALVINFGMFGFVLVLSNRACEEAGTEEVDRYTTTEEEEG